MHIAITGASGNAGTALLRNLQGQLSRKPGSLQLTGISRRRPDTSQAPYAGVRWHTLDVGLESDRPRLEAALAGVDSVVHLAWQIQPNRDLKQLHRSNVTGTRIVLEAAGKAGVKHIVCASSVGAYSKAPKDRRTDETWPAGGITGSHYSRHKAAQEELLDAFMAAEPGISVARLRPGLIFQGAAGRLLAEGASVELAIGVHVYMAVGGGGTTGPAPLVIIIDHQGQVLVSPVVV